MPVGAIHCSSKHCAEKLAEFWLAQGNEVGKEVSISVVQVSVAAIEPSMKFPSRPRYETEIALV